MVMFVLFGGTMLGQTANPLVGAWNLQTDPKFPQSMLIFSADGHYAQVAISPGRSKPKNDFDHRTREELMKQFGGLRAQYGTWKVDGNKLIRMRTASEEPGAEGTQAVAEFRIEGDTLVLKGLNAQNENRFRRMK
jgi:hypothetical protein